MSLSKLRVAASGKPGPFKFLKVNELDPTGLYFFIGKRGTGKTYLCVDICYNWWLNGMKDGARIDMVVAFSPTEDLKGDFRVFVPYALLFPRFSESVVMELVKKQKEHMKKYGRCQNILLIVDDCAFEKGFFKTEIMRFIAMNLRHYKICVIITCQYALDVPPPIRGNIDYCFCMRDNSMSNKKRYHEHFYGQIPTFKNFCEIFDDLTDSYGVLVGNNKVQSSKLIDTIFWYRAKPDAIPDEFRMGRAAYWKMTKKAFIDEDAEPQSHSLKGDADGKPRNDRSSVMMRKKNEDGNGEGVIEIDVGAEIGAGIGGVPGSYVQGGAPYGQQAPYWGVGEQGEYSTSGAQFAANGGSQFTGGGGGGGDRGDRGDRRGEYDERGGGTGVQGVEVMPGYGESLPGTGSWCNEKDASSHRGAKRSKKKRKKKGRKDGRRKSFNHTASSIMRINQPTLPIDIVI